MKSKFLLFKILIVGLILVNFSVSMIYGQSSQNKPGMQKTITYTCPMHPEIVQNYPGNCPKCGMALVVKTEKLNGNMYLASDSTTMKNDHKKMMTDSTFHEKK
jgi:hypothetical protein